MLQAFLIIVKLLVLLILTVLGLFLTLLFTLLLIPFRIEGRARKDDPYEADIHITWLWRLVVVELVFLPHKKLILVKLLHWKIFTHEIKPKPVKVPKKDVEKRVAKKADKKVEKKERARKRRPSASELLGQATSTMQRFSLETFQEILHFLLNLFSSLRLRLYGEARVGLGNPADTGMLLGLFYAVTGALRIDNFLFHPNWDDLSLEGNLELYARVWLAEIMLIVLKTMLAKSIRKIWWPYIKQALNPFNKARPRSVES